MDPDILISYGNSGAVRNNNLVIRLVPERSCWVNLPTSLCHQLHQQAVALPLALRLTPSIPPTPPDGAPRPPACFVAWGGGTSSSSSIEVPAALANCLRLKNGLQVGIEALPQVPVAETVEVEPVGVEDWEVLQLNAEAIEENLLSQVGVMAKGQPICIWTGQACIRCTTSSCKPGNVVRLSAGTEVHVAPKPRLPPPQTKAPTTTTTTTTTGPTSSLGTATGTQPKQALLPSRQLNTSHSLRTLLLPQSFLQPFSTHSNMTARTWLTSAVLLHQDTAARASLQAGQLTCISAIAPVQGSNEPITVVVLTSCLCPPGHILLAPPLMQLLQVTPHSQVQITTCPLDPPTGESPTHRLDTTLYPLLLSPTPVPIPEGVQGEQQQAQAWPVMLQAPAQQPHGKAHQAEQAGQAVVLQSALGLWWRAQVTLMQHVLATQPCAAPATPAALPSRAVSGMLMHLHQANTGPPGGADFYFKLDVQQVQKSRHTKTDTVAVGALTAMFSPALRYPTSDDSAYLDTSSTSRVTCLTPGAYDSWQVTPSHSAGQAVLASAKLVHDSLQSVVQRLGIAHHEHVGGHVLITGPTGSGKLQTVRGVTTAAALNVSCPWHVIHVKCDQLSGGGSSKHVLPCVDRVLAEAQAAAPCLVVLQDIEGLAPNMQGDDDPRVAHSDHVQHVVGRLMQAAAWSSGLPGSRQPPIRLLATARLAGEVHPALRQAGLLDSEVRLSAPGLGNRLDVLLGRQPEGLQLLDEEAAHKLAALTEGYDPMELGALLDRAAHLLTHRLVSGKPAAALPAVEVDRLVAGYEPPSFWSLKGRKATSKEASSGWQDVGGMTKAKKLLLDALILPLQHQAVAATAPLRLRTGLLLFGPPGCGKTHLVQAAAAQAQATHNVRFISVKGPELLNKYIGASEAAVRDLFERAAVAAPCVLFFDEFDAIAPPRGHDSTGVTDRVVNQLLTELDGVEGLQGVVVLAATSRPDMIDAALLRPGRLDRLVYCGFPDAKDRLRILQCLSRQLVLEPDVDLQALADQTAGFSGADLSALLAEAQLAGVHECLDGATSTVQLSMRHLEQALLSVSPSVPDHEKHRLGQLYAKFKQDRTPGAQHSTMPTKLRATQA